MSRLALFRMNSASGLPVPTLNQSLGEQIRTALREANEGAAIVNFQPAQANGAIETRRVFLRRPFVAEQERAVDLLDVNLAILNRLEGVRVLHQTAGGWIGSTTAFGEVVKKP